MNFSFLKEYMDRLTNWIIPGNNVVVYKDNIKVYEYSSGCSDLEHEIKMNGQELFYIYSCSKITTVTAALQLYERGYFLLSDNLSDYMPEFKDMYVKTADGIEKAQNPIKIKDLFTMTAGFSYDLNLDAYGKARKITNGKMDTRTVIKCLAEEPLCFEPGLQWHYSMCHDVLAALVEVISGMKFSEYVKTHIFEPLEMNSSYYHTDAGIAPQYICKAGNVSDAVEMQKSGKIDGISDVIIERQYGNDLIFGEEYDSGGAGIITKIDDYAKIIAALSNKGLGINGNRILSSKTVELMKTNHLSEEQIKYFNWEHLSGYGYGLGVRTLMDKAKSGSNGSLGEFGWCGAAGATAIIDTDINLAVFYAHHMLYPQEEYYMPRLRNVIYSCLD